MTSRSATATRASGSARSGETPASASSGWPRISWKRTAAQPPARIASASPAGTGTARSRGAAASARAVLSSSSASSDIGAWNAKSRCSSPAREAAVKRPSSDSSRRVAVGRRPAGRDHAALGLPQAQGEGVPRARGARGSRPGAGPSVRPPETRPRSPRRERRGPTGSAAARARPRPAARGRPRARRLRPRRRPNANCSDRPPPPPGARALLAAHARLADLPVAPLEARLGQRLAEDLGEVALAAAERLEPAQDGVVVPVHVRCSVLTSGRRKR